MRRKPPRFDAFLRSRRTALSPCARALNFQCLAPGAILTANPAAAPATYARFAPESADLRHGSDARPATGSRPVDPVARQGQAGGSSLPLHAAQQLVDGHPALRKS